MEVEDFDAGSLSEWVATIERLRRTIVGARAAAGGPQKGMSRAITCHTAELAVLLGLCDRCVLDEPGKPDGIHFYNRLVLALKQGALPTRTCRVDYTKAFLQLRRLAAYVMNDGVTEYDELLQLLASKASLTVEAASLHIPDHLTSGLIRLRCVAHKLGAASTVADAFDALLAAQLVKPEPDVVIPECASSWMLLPVMLESILLLAPFSVLITFVDRSQVSQPYVKIEHIAAS